jgi:DNA polymerase epsilon subunit 3
MDLMRLRRAHEVSTSKQHKSISASDVFKALEMIEFADLIPPLQAELQGAPFPALSFSPSLTTLLSVYRELAKSKKGSAAAGASSSAPPARSKTGAGGSSAAAQRGKGKERTTESTESHVSAPLPSALDALSLDSQPRVQVHEPSAPPDADEETHAVVEQEPEPDVREEEGEGEGVGVDEEDDEDQTEPEVGFDEAEEDVDEADDDVNVDVDVDVDVDMDINAPEDGDDMADGVME